MTVATTASKPKKQSSAPPPPPRVDRALVTKAVEALLKYHAKQSAASSDLLGNDSPIQVQLTLEIAPERAQHKPISVLLPHPIHKLNSSSSNQDDDSSSLEMEEICLIVKEEAKPAIQDVIQKHFPNELKCIKKVMGLQSLRTKHATSFAQRRSLLHKYTTFLADDRILPMLTSALGRDFYKYKKKQPIPIKVTNPNNLPLMLQKALGGGTHLYLPAGTCVTVRAGHTTMSASNLVDNILAVCASYRCSNNNNHQQQLLLNHSLGAIRKIPRQWANVRQIAIKTANSTALPVYNATPAQLEELTRLAGLEPVWKKNNKSKSANSKDKNYAETTTTTTATVTKDKEAVTTKKKKSPLLRALEKQKKQQQQQDDVVVSTLDKKQQAETTTTKKPKRKNNSNAETKDTSTAKESKTRDKKSNKKDTSFSLLSPSAEKSSARGKRKNSDADADNDDDDNNTSSPSSKKLKNNNSSSSSKQEPSEPTFIASKRFKGSKQGYMFQKGPKGIGYYVDVKPIVDRMALEAIFRMTAAQNQQHRGNTKSKSPRGRGGKGKRNSHRRR